MTKSFEALEKDYWGEPKYGSHLTTTCHRLRKIQLKDFETEDLRIMIGQNIGLKYLIPLAIKTLEENILADGDFYEGDLLKSVLTSDIEYWKVENENWTLVCSIFNENIGLIEKEAMKYNTGKQIIKSFKEFKKINK